jgi:hypothetical protein
MCGQPEAGAAAGTDLAANATAGRARTIGVAADRPATGAGMTRTRHPEDSCGGLPYAGLSPEVVIAAVEEAGHVCDGRVLALNSYENRVYQVGIEGRRPLVVKF